MSHGNRNLLLLLLAGLGLLMASVADELPSFGDHQSRPAQHVARTYIEDAYIETHTPNIVTVMIADYRSFDTFKETMVVFTAGLACLVLLGGSTKKEKHSEKEKGHKHA